MTAEQLVQDVPVQIGDAPDFTTFDSVYRPRLTRYLGRCYRADQWLDIPEAVQETLVRAFGNFSQLDPRRDPWPWLVVVARNVVTDAGRRDARTVAGGEKVLAMLQAADPTPDAQAISRDDRRLLRKALAAVPTHQRIVVMLHLFEDMTFADIATYTGANEACVRQWFRRGRVGVARQFTSLGGKRFGLAPPAFVLSGLHFLRGGGARASALSSAAGVAATELLGAAALSILGGALVIGPQPDTGTPAMIGSVGSLAQMAPALTKDMRFVAWPRTPSVPTGSGVLAPARPANKPAEALIVALKAHVSMAKTPFARGVGFRGTIAIASPAGTIKVTAREVTGEGRRPVCDAGLVRCE